MPGKFLVMSLPVRLTSRTLPSCRNARARKPSSFGSNNQPGDEKTPSTACASIGLSVRGIRAGLPNEAAPAASDGSGSPARSQLLQGQPAHDRPAVVEDVALRVGVGVPVLDEQPLVRSARRAHERPRALHLVTAQRERQLPRVEAGEHPALRLVAVAPTESALVRGVDAHVPDDHLPGAVVPVADDAFERGVAQRMVLDEHGEALLGVVGGRPLRHRPRLERAAELQPEVVVQAGGGVLLHDERERAGPPLVRVRGGLVRPAEVAFLFVPFQRHRRS